MIDKGPSAPAVIVKSYANRNRSIADIRGRLLMPESSIPLMYDFNFKSAMLEYLPFEFHFNTPWKIKLFINFLYNTHLKIAEALSQQKKEENLYIHEPIGTIATNRQCYSLIGRRGIPPVKIGDLKPEHIRTDLSGAIKICDYETAGLGYLFEDLVWCFYSISRSTQRVWMTCFQEYISKRVKKLVSLDVVRQCLRLTFQNMVVGNLELRRTEWVLKV